MKRRLLILLLPFFSLASCKGNYPLELVILGLPGQLVQAEISGIFAEDEQLTIQLNGMESESRVVISPWPDKQLALLPADTLRSFTRFSPSGPIQILELLNGAETIAVIGNDTTAAVAPLPDWTAKEGSRIGLNGTGERIWVELILERGPVSISVKPGRPITIESQGQRWHFLLLGASVPNPDLEANHGGLAIEQKTLSVDWLLYP